MIKKLNVPISFPEVQENRPSVTYEDMKDLVVIWDKHANVWKMNNGTTYICRVSSAPMAAEAIMKIGIDDFEEIIESDGE